ncbi:hypothetical protein [Rhodoblastus sp.]|uniref:hypothetical protein n=1 Tax=Rhodoblastus sp. TaxID=1962975 RepID=UPI003F97EA90
MRAKTMGFGGMASAVRNRALETRRAKTNAIRDHSDARKSTQPDDRVLRRGRLELGGRMPSKFYSGLRLEWVTPFRTPGKKDKPLR